ncbi:hypothetical protein [Massilia sp. CT11-137]|uniref:hypothetical protein n=1 Tax=Massilia sp. CT11-137 TaxID=3393901 RepID=UPI0039B0FFCF
MNKIRDLMNKTSWGWIVALGMVPMMIGGCGMRDDTDPPNGISGVDPITDNATGCQYLYRRHAMVPRIAADGKTHMGCKGA